MFGLHERSLKAKIKKTSKFREFMSPASFVFLGLFQKKIPRGGGGGKGKQYIFLWVIGADIFQMIWIIDVYQCNFLIIYLHT